jgi:DNA-binding SARP family transcriptional activator
VVYSGGWYRLNLEAGVAVDVAEFDQLVDTADQLTQRAELDPAAEAYQSAVDLYHGDLCVGPDIQSLIERERVRARFLTVLARLADYHFAADDYAACLAVGQRLLAVDGCREDAHRLVMRCHVRRGERGQALRQYRLCESILAGEFNAPPEPATTALFERIRLDPAGV